MTSYICDQTLPLVMFCFVTRILVQLCYRVVLCMLQLQAPSSHQW